MITHFHGYYKRLLGTTDTPEQLIQPEVMVEGPVLTIEQQLALLGTVTPDEIKAVVWSIPMEKSAGPDGFGSGFYRDTWSIIGGDVIQAIQMFFKTGSLFREMNSTLIMLLPKTEHPHTTADYRPIACCGVLYKVITKSY